MYIIVEIYINSAMLMMTGVRHNWGEEPGDWDLRVEDSRQPTSPTSPTSVNLLKPNSQNYVWLICKTIFNYRELGFILTFLWYFFLLFVTVRNCWTWLHCLCLFHCLSSPNSSSSSSSGLKASLVNVANSWMLFSSSFSSPIYV